MSSGIALRVLKLNDMKREVKIGLFAVAVLLAAWAAAKFLKGAEIFGNTNRYYAYYEQVGGIQTASHVLIYGVKVGSVTRVELDEDMSKGVRLELSVDKRYRIPADSKAKIFNNGVMGGKAIEIVMGASSDIIPDDGTIASETGTDIFDMAGAELEFFKNKITAVADGLTAALDGINILLTENTADINSIVANVDGLTGNVNDMLSKEKEHMEVALSSLSRFSKSLGDNAEKIDTIMNNMSRFSSELAEADLVGSIEDAVDNLNSVLALANDGSGSVGRLLKDPELYDNLASATENLSVLLADLKENPKRYVHFSVFGNDPSRKARKAAEKEAKKEAKRNAKSAAAEK